MLYRDFFRPRDTLKDQIIHITVTVIFVIVMEKDLIQLSVFCSFNSGRKKTYSYNSSRTKISVRNNNLKNHLPRNC